MRRTWKIAPKANAAFVAAMEDVLDVYARPRDPERPLVCFDETCKQQLREVVEPLPPQAGSPARSESTYERNGVSNLLLAFAPLEQWRHIWVADRRDASTWAHCIRELVEVHFPDAERIVLVLDNLSTHTASALYSTFTPEEAKRIWDRLEVHYTPKHGSWLNMAEIELSVLSRQCLDRRIPDQDTLRHEASTWVDERNVRKATIVWRFTTADARVKLKKLYPILNPSA